MIVSVVGSVGDGGSLSEVDDGGVVVVVVVVVL